MHNWFECKVRYIKIDDKTGKEKKVTEPYLVDALSFTEAEARMNEELAQIVSEEFLITNISKCNITDVFFYDDGDYWFKCKVNIIDCDDATGKEKKVPNMMLVPAKTVKQAYERIEEQLSKILSPWEIFMITQSPIVDLFPFFKKEDEPIDNVVVPKNLKKLTDSLLTDEELEKILADGVIDENLKLDDIDIDEDIDLEDEVDDEFADEFADEDELSEEDGFSIGREEDLYGGNNDYDY